jgi:hypothetical protein
MTARTARLILISLSLLALLAADPLALLAAVRLIGQNIEITDRELGEEDALDPSIAVLGNNVYAVWNDHRTSTEGGLVYFARSTDGGATWSDNRQLDPPTDQVAFDPEIAVQADGTIWVIWYLYERTQLLKANEIWLARSTDGGVTFTSSMIANGDDSNNDLHGSLLAINDRTGNIHVLLHPYDFNIPGYNITLATFVIARNQWQITQVNRQAGSGRGDSPVLGFNGPQMSLTVRNGVVCAAWEDRRDRHAIYGACSADQGATFSPDAAISGADAIIPKIALAPDGVLYAAYLEEDPENNILLRRSLDRARTWSAAQTVTDVESPSYANTCDLLVDNGGNLLLAWVDRHPWNGNFSDLYLASSTDGGRSFSTVPVEDGRGRFPGVAEQSGPSLARNVDGSAGTVFLAWADDRDVFNRIWLARGASSPTESRVYLPLLGNS